MVSCWYANKFRAYVPELEKVLLEMKLELSNRISALKFLKWRVKKLPISKIVSHLLKYLFQLPNL